MSESNNDINTNTNTGLTALTKATINDVINDVEDILTTETVKVCETVSTQVDNNSS